jgi:hypothetical protein
MRHSRTLVRLAIYAQQALNNRLRDSGPVSFGAMNFFPFFLQTALTTSSAPWLLTEVMKTTMSAPQTTFFSRYLPFLTLPS